MIFHESPLKDLYRRALWGPGRRALEALPPPTELRLVRRAGREAARALGGKRRTVGENLARAFPQHPPAGLDEVAAQAFGAHFCNQYLGFSFGKCTAQNWEKYLRFDGLEHLEAARDLGRGVVLAHPHMGPAQLPLHVLGRLGWDVHQVGGGRVTLVDLSATGRWAAQTRARLESRMPVTLHDGKGYLRPLLRALKGGGVVLSACDATGGGEELGRRLVRTVCGQPMPLPVGPVWMAWRSGAPLLTLRTRSAIRDPAPFVAEIGPPVAFTRDQGMGAALESGASAMAGFLDESLRRYPGDWLFWDGFRPGGLLAAGGP